MVNLNLDDKYEWILLKKAILRASDTVLIGVLQITVNEIYEREIKKEKQIKRTLNGMD